MINESSETTTAEPILRAGQRLCERLRRLKFSAPVTHVYNPMEYAWDCYEAYVRRYAKASCRVLFLGMNPGPWGMAQTGIPFGEVAVVRDWLGIQEQVKQPPRPHPRRPVQGFACRRSEVSGRRLWGLFAERFSSPNSFFQDHFVINHCPLVFMEAGGRNRTPDKLLSAEVEPALMASDEHLTEILSILQPEWVVGVGGYAQERAAGVVESLKLARESILFLPKVTRILHPSPASPAANRDWAGSATRQLIDAGVWEK